MKSMNVFRTHPLLLGLAVFVVSLICLQIYSNPAIGSEKIRARFTQPRGTHITWKIKIPSPAPAAVIVNQYIRPGSSINGSSHPVNAYDKQKGVAKWILTGIKPGTLKMYMKIDKPIRKKGEIRGEIIFQDQNANTIASVLMKPKAKKKAIEGC